MDPASNGTEIQTQIPTSKVRPPPVAKKPKPSIAKKPVLAQKPDTLPPKPSLNGTVEIQKNEEKDDTTSRTNETSLSNTSDISTPVPTDRISNPTKSTSSEKPVLARPKEPPPPLPRTPPKGPATKKVLPPLPKTPPKGPVGVKAIDSSQKPSEQFNTADKTLNSNSHISEALSVTGQNKTAVQAKVNEQNGQVPPVKPKPRRKTIDTCTVVANSNEGIKPGDGKEPNIASQPDLNNSVESNAKHKTFIEREISVGNSTWFQSSLDEGQEQIALNKLNDDLEADSKLNSGNKSAALERVTSIGNSTWFIEPNNQKDHLNIEKNKNNSVTREEKVHSNTEVQKHSDREKSSGSSCLSPARTPPPVPKKLPHKELVPNSAKLPEPCDKNSANNNCNPSYSCDNGKTEEHGQEISNANFNLNVSVRDCAIKDNIKGSQPRAKPRTSISSVESLEIQPKVVSRKPIPGVKPRPTPKKRSSVNRLSGSEQSEITEKITGNLDNQVVSFKKETEGITLNQDTTKSVSVNSTQLQKKANENDLQQEKQYRVIDKNILGESRQNTDQGSVQVETASKNLPENKQESSVPFSVVELRKKFKENRSDAQIDVPNTDDIKSDNADTISDIKEERKSSSDHTPSSLKDSFEELLSDKAILEPSSLLNEIEEILSRSYKHSSLTRSGSSPEKRGVALLRDIDVKCERRSQSFDLSPEQKTSTPVRPPRPKKEAKRLRSMSQITFDSCASDTESLPDLSITGEDQLPVKDYFIKACTLGPAKPHPPKPKRNKLLKVQRSHSDVTKMKSFIDQMETRESKTSPNKGQSLKPGTSVSNENVNSNVSLSPQSRSSRAKRPTRKAPLPPTKVTVRPPSEDLNMVVPVDARVKSSNLEKRLSQKENLEDTAGSIYDSIKDVEAPYSSDEDHDYHEIPEHLKQGNRDSDSRSKSGSPPKLPPRNYSNSNSFDSSSQSGLTCSVSAEDLSVCGAVIKNDSGSKTNSPLGKRRQISKPLPSPFLNRKLEEIQNLDRSGLSGSSESIPESLDGSTGSRTRPVSNASEMTVTSSESEGEDEETKIAKKKEKKLFFIAQEVVSSERVFVDVLKLLNVDFRLHISTATENLGRPVIPSETLNRILDYLPQLQNFNEDLLKDLEERIGNWDTKKGIADIFVRKGPFLKLYTSYIRDFETMTATLDEAVKKNPAFQSALKEFELGPRCASLALKHYMLKPIQRIPQYRLLLQDYMKHLPADSPEMKDMQTALNIVSEVAEHANENMRHGDYVQKMLEIQRSLIGQFEIIKPGRSFVKEGELMKLSRKEMQPRFFFLFNDVLLYTTPVATGYKLNNVLPLAGMKVSVSGQDDFKNEFSIISVQRSFTLASSTLEERDDWVSALNSAIEENAMKRNTFESVRAGTQSEYWDTYQVLLDKDFVLGHKPPIWIPDARVTMCMLCTCEFTVTWRRHHCRACGRVVCGNCSDCKAPLRYLKYKEGRVCDECYKTLVIDKDGKDGPSDQNDGSGGKEGDDNWLSIPGLFERFTRLRTSKGADKKMVIHRPKVLTEVTANDQDALMSGYLHKLKGKKWKRQWFVLKDKVLYQYKATQDQAATESMVLLGYEVVRFTEFYEGVEPGLLFQLSHSNTPPIVFRTDSTSATEKWVTVMREASVA